jgi:hypothetical protein
MTGNAKAPLNAIARSNGHLCLIRFSFIYCDSSELGFQETNAKVWAASKDTKANEGIFLASRSGREETYYVTKEGARANRAAR